MYLDIVEGATVKTEHGLGNILKSRATRGRAALTWEGRDIDLVPNRNTRSCKRPIDGVIPTMAIDNRELDKTVLSSRGCKRGQQGNPGV
jgi:hypothetical protein